MLKVKLLSYTPNPEEVVASAAKLCYSSVGVDEIMEAQDNQSIQDFISKLAKIKHYSPFEHASFSFAIEGVSRTLTHQLVRHRIASYSQKSQRYVKEDLFEYIIPNDIKENEKAKKTFINQMKSAQKAYNNLFAELMIDKIFNHEKYEAWYAKITELEIENNNWHLVKIANNLNNLEGKMKYIQVFQDNFKKEYNALEKQCIEDARYVFPNAIETKIVITMNARTLLHFFQLRSCSRAQSEIRDLSDEMLSLVYKVAPAIFKMAGPACTWGKCDQGTMSCGTPRSFEDLLNKK